MPDNMARSIISEFIVQNLRMNAANRVRKIYFKDPYGRPFPLEFREYHAHLYRRGRKLLVKIDAKEKWYVLCPAKCTLLPLSDMGQAATHLQTFKFLLDILDRNHLEDETGMLWRV